MLVAIDTIQLLVVSLVPLGLYLILLGFINVLGRPLVLSGRTDAFLLAVAVSGLLVTGTVELVLEVTPLYRLYSRFPLVPWLLYAVLAAAWIASSSGHLVVYCTREHELLRALERAAAALGQSLRQGAGRTTYVFHPSELALDVRPFDALDAATVYLSDPAAAKTILCELRAAYREQWDASRSPNWSLAAILFTFAGSVLVAYPAAWLLR